MNKAHLPFLPGFSFIDPTKCKFSLPQTLTYDKGYRIPCMVQKPTPKLAFEFLEAENILKNEKFGDLTYGRRAQVPKKVWIPAFVAYDKKVLRFFAYFKQIVPFSSDDTYRIRRVNIYYYLEDDTMRIVEPSINNSGLLQGVLLRRQRFPKNSLGEFWNWRDLNVAMNFTIYGNTYRIYDCDKWTKEFLTSEGIEVNPSETAPVDPYLERQKFAASRKLYTTPSPVDSLWKFLHFDRQILRFYCIWDDRDNMYGDIHYCILNYYLADDSIEILEVHEINNGRDPNPVLVKRHRIPKDRSAVSDDFPLINLDLTEAELDKFYSHKDLGIGKTLLIYNRKLFLYDCDSFTQEFYRKYYGVEDFTPIDVRPKPPKVFVPELPPHTDGLGTWEDSLQSYYNITLRPKIYTDLAKFLLNHPKYLRYTAIMEPKYPHDKDRKFIIYYYLSDDTVMIFEPPITNSGFIGGTFLSRQKLLKSGGIYEEPVYYSLKDFFLGAVIEAAGQKFIIEDADQYVLNYMELHPNLFTESSIASMRAKFKGDGLELDQNLGPKEETILDPTSGNPVSFTKT
ncbi:EF-hand domain-containing protein 1-like isoform X1 [Centruroides vittatus]|uniref:EF-hand domain-containing protein 1-like isoform X1 n=1 Tax=Centruroides vittatus TaxID=120091 RepID=UPI00350FC2DE